MRVFGSKTASSQGVFPSLVQDHASGTQQCHTVQNCHVKGLVNYAQQSILCGNEAFPGLASLLPFPFINPKGVRDCWGEEFYIWQNHQIFFFPVLKEMVLNPNLLIKSVPCRVFALDYFKLGAGAGKGLVKLQGWFEFGICGGT